MYSFQNSFFSSVQFVILAMFPRVNWWLLHERRIVLSLIRQVRGTVVKEPQVESGQEYRVQYGVKRPAGMNEPVDHSRRVASFYGHPRLAIEESDDASQKDEEDIQSSTGDSSVRSTVVKAKIDRLKPGFDVIEREDTVALDAERGSTDAPLTGGSSLSEYTPVLQPVPASRRKPRSFLQTYTLAPLVNDSELLRNLVDVGVNLSKFDNLYNVADWLIKLDWTNDVKPRLRFLTETAGVPLEKLGEYVTANPWILQQSLDDMNTRIQYLRSKKFSEEAIHRIVSKAVFWLNFYVKTVDKRIGFLQKTFQLSGDDVRFVVTHSPKLITIGSGYTELLMFSFKEEMGFNEAEMRQLLIKDPRLYLTPRPVLAKSFDYVHNEMKFSHSTILNWPSILRARVHDIRDRHKYLKSLGRDQYDPEKPNYVSLSALSAINDLEFAVKVAKTSIAEYNKFLKRN